MSPSATWRGKLPKLSFSAENRHHGLQLAAAVLLSYGLALLIGLPEQLWAVMSTLIVMRPQAGGTLHAGGERIAGTLAGVLCALAGVLLHHWGVAGLGVTLGVVAALAYVGAASPALRSAPVAALIILSGAAIPGHSPLQIAGLRVAQIAIGVAVALAISMLSARYRAAQRLHAGCAELLRQLALQLPQGDAADQGPADDGAQEAAGAATRTAVGRLLVLAASADRESRLFRRGAPVADARQHQRIAGLLRRIVQDVAMLNRVLRSATSDPASPLEKQAAQAAAAALGSVADVLASLGDPGAPAKRPALGELRQLAHAEVAGAHDPRLMLAAPQRLLLADLQRLCHVVGVRATPADSADPA